MRGILALLWINRYVCNVFFIVLDLRLTKDWLPVTGSLFFCPFL